MVGMYWACVAPDLKKGVISQKFQKKRMAGFFFMFQGGLPMGFTIDFSEFEKYVKAMKATERDFNNFLRDFLLRMANEILRETKLKQSGHYGEDFKAYDTGAMTNAWTLGSITGSGRDISVEIINPMEYATDIEYGHRIVVGTGENKKEVGWFDGKFMLKTSIENIQRQMPAAYDIAFRQFCKSHGIV